MRWLTLLLALGLVAAPRLRGETNTHAGPQEGSAPVISEALAAQVMLDRVGFSPGEIDGQQGANLKRALAAFQTSRHLPPTGALDDATWKELQQNTEGARPLVSYVVTPADIAGPFTPDIPADLMEQSKLGALSYRTPLEALAERFHSSPMLLTSLNPDVMFGTVGASLTVPNVEGAPAPPAANVTVIVSKATGALTVQDESHHVIFHAPVTSGSQHDPLPLGTWKINGVQQNPTFNYNPALFWDANPSHSKARIAPGPNNPVGTVWIDISKEHYGIHGTPEPSKIGHAESHGCVRLTNWDAQRVAAMVKPGTAVIFR